MMPTHAQPMLFSLMARLTAEERQKLGERRRQFKSHGTTEERLVQDAEGEWSLEYWADGKRKGKLKISTNV